MFIYTPRTVRSHLSNMPGPSNVQIRETIFVCEPEHFSFNEQQNIYEYHYFGGWGGSEVRISDFLLYILYSMICTSTCMFKLVLESYTVSSHTSSGTCIASSIIHAIPGVDLESRECDCLPMLLQTILRTWLPLFVAY